MEAVLNDQDFMRQIAYDTMHDFIDHERRHMAMEERLVFPAALKALRPADWAEIALKLADRHDPLVTRTLKRDSTRCGEASLNWKQSRSDGIAQPPARAWEHCHPRLQGR